MEKFREALKEALKDSGGEAADQERISIHIHNETTIHIGSIGSIDSFHLSHLAQSEEKQTSNG